MAKVCYVKLWRTEMKINWNAYRLAPPPSQNADQLRMRQDRWARVHKGLYLLSSTGWGLVRELAAELARLEGLPEDSYSPRRVIQEYLSEAKLVEQGVLPYLGAIELSVVRLSELGEAVCRAYGWMIAESEWGRLVRLHEGEQQVKHTGATLAFAREARLRGYRVKILPEIKDKSILAEPDMYVIDNQRRRAYVEVEAGFHREKPDKWSNQKALQGFAAVVTKTEVQRQRVVESIKSLAIPGRATDLETLWANAQNGDPYFLFVQRWDEHGNEIPLPRELAK